MGGISNEAIRERAYIIWVREGRQHGRDFDHWVRAQVELEAEVRGNGADSPCHEVEHVSGVAGISRRYRIGTGRVAE